MSKWSTPRKSKHYTHAHTTSTDHNPPATVMTNPPPVFKQSIMSDQNHGQPPALDPPTNAHNAAAVPSTAHSAALAHSAEHSAAIVPPTTEKPENVKQENDEFDRECESVRLMLSPLPKT